MGRPLANRYPYTDVYFHARQTQPYIHTSIVTILDRQLKHHFIILYRNHVRLPRNNSLARLVKEDCQVRGELIVMKLSSVNAKTIVNMRAGDTRLSDFAVAQ